MADGDVTTRDNRGQWKNSVDGDPSLSASFSSREEAIEAGRSLAERTGTQHIVEEADPTGVITDPDAASPDSPPAPDGDGGDD